MIGDSVKPMADRNTWSFSQAFIPQFQAMRTELETQIEAARIRTPISPDLLQEVSVSLAKLTKALGDATGLIPGYDQKQYEIQLMALEQSIESLRSSLPKPKFLFKRKQPQVKPQTSLVHESVTNLHMQGTRSVPAASNSLLFSSRSNEYLTTPASHNYTEPSDVSIYDLDNCVVDFLGNTENQTPKISVLHGRNLTNCVLYLPLIEGSVLLHGLNRCAIVLGCHQFRMHSSTKVDVYLSISSNPIIEHCQEIRFTRYVTDFLPDTLMKPNPRLFLVLDFSHIRSTPSPNFSMLDTGETTVMEEKLLALRGKGDIALAGIQSLTP